jgi:serine/threonine protein phosphatase PrpC
MLLMHDLFIFFLLIQYHLYRVFVLPHMQKRHKGGEDAAVLTDRVLSVADGVGGWAENNIDPANYSRRLC